MRMRKNQSSVFSKRRIASRHQSPSLFRRTLRCEPLEDRRLLAVIMVNTLSDTTNLNDSFTTLREAIFAANLVAGADTINFAPSIADGVPKSIVLKEGEIKITDALTITGLGSNLLTIDAIGNDSTPELKDGKGSRIFNIIGPKEGELLNVLISGLTLTRGDVGTLGGAISSTSANLTLTGSTITGNTALAGGGVYAKDGNLAILESSVSGNTAAGSNASGGGVNILNTTLRATAPTVQIRGSEIANNTSANSGGGVFARSFSPTAFTITNSHISGNKTTSLNGAGGGLYINGTGRSPATLTMEHVTIDHNTLHQDARGGAGMFVTGTNTTIAASEVTANSGGRCGGGILVNERSTFALSGSTISGNSARLSGGGIWAMAPFVSLTPTNGISLIGNTIAGNSVTTTTGDSRGGGVYLDLRSSGLTTISGTTFRENTAGSGGGVAARISAGELVINESHFTSNKAIGNGTAAGGGLHLTGTVNGATIRNSTFEGNIAQSMPVGAVGQGGGIFSTAPKLSIEGSLIAANKSGFWGGGISVSGAVTISQSEIIGNAAQALKGIGGGIFQSSQGTAGSLLVTDSAISGNTATLNGGGAYLSSGSAVSEFQRVTFNENSAVQDGGAIGASGRRVVLRDSTLSRNTAGRNGGGVLLQQAGQLTINGSTLNNNTAGGNGGGVAVTGGTVNTTNSTLSANRATGNGGGLWSSTGASLAYSTIFQNRADQTGGGVFLTAGTGSIRNTVIAQNIAPLGRDLSGLLGVTLNVHYSFIGSNQSSGLTPAPVSAPDANGNIIGGVSGIDPQLGLLTNNGGPTATHMPGNESPLINHGDPSAVAGQQEVPQFDQRGAGFPRVANGRLDIGSLEVQPVAMAGDFDGNGSVDGADFLVWRKSNGSTSDLRADANGDGQVGDADYSIWRTNFGMLPQQQTSSVAQASSAGSSDQLAVMNERGDLAPVAAAVISTHNSEQTRTSGTPTAPSSIAIAAPSYQAAHDSALQFFADAPIVAVSRRLRERVSHRYVENNWQPNDAPKAMASLDAAVDEAFASLARPAVREPFAHRAWL